MTMFEFFGVVYSGAVDAIGSAVDAVAPACDTFMTEFDKGMLARAQARVATAAQREHADLHYAGM
jgi:hypothetical protein